MLLIDQFHFNWRIFKRHRLRTFLMLLAVSIGVAAVVLLTSLGEGARRYVDAEFSSLGSNLVIIFPGRNETTGGHPPIFGTSPRDLTIEDSIALGHLSAVRRVAPIIVGTTNVSVGSLSRDLITVGTTREFLDVRDMSVTIGKTLPDDAREIASAVCVLGSKVKHELFGSRKAVGEWVRIGDRRMRVIGIIEEGGQSIGMDMADIVMVPVQTAVQLFNSPALFRLMLELQTTADVERVKRRVLAIIRERHEGEEDITLVTQDSLLQAFNNILSTLTLAIGAIGAIGLLVAGVLIMNISLISVSQRRQEIGLLKAIGGSSRQIRALFLGESLMMVGMGALAGVAVAIALVFFSRQLWPVFPMTPPSWAIPVAVILAMVTGVLFSWLPASRAARLDPVLALRGQQQ